MLLYRCEKRISTFAAVVNGREGRSKEVWEAYKWWYWADVDVIQELVQPGTEAAKRCTHGLLTYICICCNVKVINCLVCGCCLCRSFITAAVLSVQRWHKELFTTLTGPIIINVIYMEQIRKDAASVPCWLVQAFKNVFSRERNTDSDMSSRSAAGELFHTVLGIRLVVWQNWEQCVWYILRKRQKSYKLQQPCLHAEAHTYLFNLIG